LKELDLWIGVEFAGALKGKKRQVRKLVGGVFVFGEGNLPIQIHGKDCVGPAEEIRLSAM
jgi:hypothetical protein